MASDMTVALSLAPQNLEAAVEVSASQVGPIVIQVAQTAVQVAEDVLTEVAAEASRWVRTYAQTYIAAHQTCLVNTQQYAGARSCTQPITHRCFFLMYDCARQ